LDEVGRNQGGMQITTVHHHFLAASRLSNSLATLQVGLLPFVCCALSLHVWAAPDASQKSIDTDRSSIAIHVYKAGLLSAFGHEHEINAKIERGTIDEAQRTIEFVVDARTLRVMDRDVSDKDRAEIQSTMLGSKVLDSEKFREIRFRSTRIESNGNGKLTVHGDLSLHGETHPVTVDVESTNGHYRGSATLRQKSFGITPITVAGGSIKVKDEIRVDFEIFVRSEAK
jgi:polyisoprenoid-binding protein YceI